MAGQNIHLLGPGGAGKTTTGCGLALRLGLPFLDLDAHFTANHGDISGYIDRHGYPAYARQNANLCAALIPTLRTTHVLALSSGFMTYPDEVHPGFSNWRQQMAASETTFVLLPSLDEETCVQEIIRRQGQRPFARTPEREEQVIRARFPHYVRLPAMKIETLRPIAEVVADLAERYLAWVASSHVSGTSPGPLHAAPGHSEAQVAVTA